MNKLIGNKPAAESLTRLVQTGRVPNALLFAGPEGVGKKQFAIELARALVCSMRGESGVACGLCTACRRVGEFAIPVFEKGDESKFVFFSQHPDVGMVVPFRRNLLIDAVRALEVESHFQPFEAKARVFIVEDADKMNEAASNALLKTLEEPPTTSHIVLIASRADRLLPTIRSRCQVIRFGPVDSSVLQKFLLDTGRFSEEDAKLVARVSRGSVGRALSMVPASFRTHRSLMLEALEAAVADDKRKLLAASEEMTDAKAKDEYDEKLAVLEDLIHDAWLLSNGADRTAIRNIDIASELSQIAAAGSSPTFSSWLTEIETMRENFIVNLNRKVATDALFLKMTA